jgi:hypothetical protein
VGITYAISPSVQRIRVYSTGIIRASDLRKFLTELLEDPALRPGLRALYDARFAEPDITVLELAEVAGIVARVVARGVSRVAIAAESANTLRVAKTFAALARSIGIDVDVFEELADAEAWLADPGEEGENPEWLLSTA